MTSKRLWCRGVRRVLALVGIAIAALTLRVEHAVLGVFALTVGGNATIHGGLVLFVRVEQIPLLLFGAGIGGAVEIRRAAFSGVVESGTLAG